VAGLVGLPGVAGASSSRLPSWYPHPHVLSRSKQSQVRFVPRRLHRAAGLSPVGLVGAGEVAFSLTGSPLVVPGMQLLDGGEQLAAAERARWASPEARVARERSRTEFEHLGAGAAASLAREAFPDVVQSPVGGVPRLPGGQRIVGFASANAARVSLPGGKRAVVESSQPMARRTGPGRWAPIDLALTSGGGGFTPASTAAPVLIPGRIADGVRLSGAGVSLTPVDGRGGALGGSDGVVDGATVLYANTEVDTDTLVKPTTSGFAVDALLRSERSPERLRFKVAAPDGARLVKDAKTGLVLVRQGGATIAVVRAPLARDAAGVDVPLKTTISGDTLNVGVAHRSGGYQYPVEVDPELLEKIDEGSLATCGAGANWNLEWNFLNFACSIVLEGGKYVESYISGGSTHPGDWAALTYETQGESVPYAGEIETSGTIEAGAEVETVFQALHFAGAEHTPVVDKTLQLAHNAGYVKKWYKVCPASCAVGFGAEGGAFRLETSFIGTAGKTFQDRLNNAKVYLTQKNNSTVSFDTTDQFIEGKPNILFNYNGEASDGWLGPYGGAYKVVAKDPGVGVSYLRVQYSNEAGEPKPVNSGNYLEKGFCDGVQCYPEKSETFTYSNKYAEGLLTHIYVNAHNAMAGFDPLQEKSVLIGVDAKAPYNLVWSGLPAGNEIGERQYRVKAEASDGEGTTPSSGMKSFELYIDGIQVESPNGYCGRGPCTAKGEWTISGQSLGAGEHSATLIATDNAYNTTQETFKVTVRHAAPLPVGPGSVNPTTGEFALKATDVNMGGPMINLGVSRTYASNRLTVGSEGPLGPQWNLNVGAEQRLKELPDGSVLLVGEGGGGTIFRAKVGGGFESPKGDSNLTISLTETGGVKEYYLLKDSTAATQVKFTRPSGTAAWVPTIAEGRIASGTETYSYQAVKVEGKEVTEPKEALAPTPSGVSCSPTLEKGCRALKFVYAETTTATGEKASEWKDYKGRLKEVTFTAWSPSSKAMQTTAVAQYSYDLSGRLRAEWDPRLATALKTTYGYDTTGRVTAVAPPGQEPWLMRYGATIGNPTVMSLLSVTRAGAETELGNGSAPSNTVVPTLSSTSPVVGTTLSVSGNGTWSNSPLSYAYQWQDCNASGAECVAIAGATNKSYTPQAHDGGFKLVAQVIAYNATGAVAASSAASNAVSMPAPTYSSAFGTTGTETEKVKEPSGLATDSSGNVLVADAAKHRVAKYSSTGSYITSYTNGGNFETPRGVAVSPVTGNLYVTDTPKNHVWELNPATGAVIAMFGFTGSSQGALKGPKGVTVDAQGNVWVADVENSRVEEFTASGSFMKSFGTLGTNNGQFKYANDVTFCGGNLYAVDNGNERIEEFSPTGSFIRKWGSSGTGNGQFTNVSRIACEPTVGDLYVVDNGNNRVQQFTQTGLFVNTFGTTGTGAGQFTGPVGVAVGSAGAVYVSDAGNNRIEKWTLSYSTNNPLPGAPAPGTTAITTIEYNVPLSGTGLPNLTKTELEKWGQTDEPVEATAIFPPDEPMGWPAENYRRATIAYLDGVERGVNVASPGGGIATTEYNSNNAVTRTLNADNRAKALTETGKTATASKELDTESTYNGEGQLVETLGPKHEARVEGSSMQVRTMKKYFYNEGAPAEGGPYSLVTKVTQAAKSGGSELEPRTTITSYSGQSNLGWKLRKPTSVTVDSGGLNKTSTTKYDESTGSVTETISPAGAETSLVQIVSRKFGTAGSGNGQFENPQGVAVDPTNGNVYVADYTLNRVEKFSSTGTFLSWVGAEGGGSGEGQLSHPESVAVSSTGNLYVGDAGNHRVEEFNSSGTYVRAFGTEGTGNGQFGSVIYGMAFDATGKLWVTDGSNHRVQEFSQTGTFEKAFGEQGTTAGKFEQPRGITVYASNLYIVDYTNNRVEEFSLTGTYVKQFGSYGLEAGQLREPWGIAVDSKGDFYVADKWPDLVAEFNASGKFVAWIGSPGSAEGQFANPNGIASNSSGELYVADQSNHRIDQWKPGNQGAHTTKTIYYTATLNETYLSCGLHAEWANLPCETKALPGTDVLSELPVTTYAYNIWDAVETVTEKFGGTTRTKKLVFDSAGRQSTSEVTSTAGTTVPKVTNEYDTATGILIKQSTTEGGTKSVTSVFDKLGELKEYIDADANKTAYVYDVDGRLKQAKYGLKETAEREAEQQYTYDETSGNLVESKDSAIGLMTASYDVEGKLTTVGYPNGMSAKYTYNPLGQATNLEYEKTTFCSSNCVMFKDTTLGTGQEELYSDKSTLATSYYTHDNVGHLTKAEETPAGGGCTTRVYSYDEEGDRTNLSSRNPTAEGSCGGEGWATEHGTVEPHSYDTAGRLTDYGVTYDAFGNTTKLPASDAGGHELTSTFYVDNQLASQVQNSQTIKYYLDPAGRTRETVSTGTINSTVISHYAGEDSTAAWTSEEAGAKWTRNITGIDGALAATAKKSETPTLQLHDLQGNVVGNAALSGEAEAKLLNPYNSSEFGVPTTTGAPPKYAWLGASGVTSEMSSGNIAEGGILYVPQLGRTVSTPSMPPASYPNGSGPGAPYVKASTPWMTSSDGAWAASAAEAEAERQRAKQKEEEESLIDPHISGLLSPAELSTMIDYFHKKIMDLELATMTVEEPLRQTLKLFLKLTGRGPVDSYIHELQDMEGALIDCAIRVTSQGPSGRCYISMSWWERKIKLPKVGTIWHWEFPEHLSVQDCLFDYYSKRDHYNYYTCIGPAKEQREYRYSH
jgi:DNA-binding beta-propeller fold protein YncE